MKNKIPLHVVLPQAPDVLSVSRSCLTFPESTNLAAWEKVLCAIMEGSGDSPTEVLEYISRNTGKHDTTVENYLKRSTSLLGNEHEALRTAHDIKISPVPTDGGCLLSSVLGCIWTSYVKKKYAQEPLFGMPLSVP